MVFDDQDIHHAYPTFLRERQNHCVNTLFRPWAIFAQLVTCDLFQGTKLDSARSMLVATIWNADDQA
ncbi:hypothetical protein BA725_10935 [Agrobacterium pusense]|nr:hypothetical protein BA725_10935 [Agrobacterium pusense]